MPFVRPNDITMHYDFSGPRDAPVVLLANSLGANVHLWDEQMNGLARAHRVLRYDMRGHGLTDETPGDDPSAATVEQLAEDATALLGALGVQRVSVVGLSLGGLVAQRIAAQHPDRVDKLVICATGNRVGPPSKWDARIVTVQRHGIDAIVEGVLGGWFTEHAHTERPELVRGFANMLRRTPVDGYIAGCRAVRNADLRADDAQIRARTLVLAGSHDQTITAQMCAELRDAIAGAELRMLHAAHMLNAEQPAAFNEALLEFLEAA
ncbi:MAG TPA: alpha/beta fold hydrolase [Candidatus Elarobacter sp.]|jgi:3-oxoadipate enol-lactonase